MRRTRVDVKTHGCHRPGQGRTLLRLGSAGAHFSGQTNPRTSERVRPIYVKAPMVEAHRV
jgi:hypothetical protein